MNFSSRPRSERLSPLKVSARADSSFTRYGTRVTLIRLRVEGYLTAGRF
jgi:hypothetical protein